MSVDPSILSIVSPESDYDRINNEIVKRVMKASRRLQMFDPARMDRDAFIAVDRLLSDYSGTAVYLNGPAWKTNLWGAAIGSNQSPGDVSFVVAESRPLALCLALLHFLEQNSFNGGVS